MKNQRGFAALEAILIVIIIAMIGGVVWYVVKQNQDMAEPKASSISETEKEPVEEYKPTTTVPDDWKIYENEKYNISFAYPGDSKVDVWEGKSTERDPGIAAYKDANVAEFTISAIKGGGEGGNSLLITFYAFDLPVEQTVENLKKYYEDSNEAEKDAFDPLIIAFTSKEIAFQGKKGFETTMKIGDSDIPTFQYYVESDGYTFALPEINPNLDPSGDNPADINISRVIVDSFKFL